MELRPSLIFLIIGLSVLAAAAVMIFFLSRGAADRALEETGIAARAKVLEITKTGINRGPNTPLAHLKLEVRPPKGEPYVVELEQGIHVMDLPRVQPGAEVAVRIDPDDPARLVLVP